MSSKGKSLSSITSPYRGKYSAFIHSHVLRQSNTLKSSSAIVKDIPPYTDMGENSFHIHHYVLIQWVGVGVMLLRRAAKSITPTQEKMLSTVVRYYVLIMGRWGSLCCHMLIHGDMLSAVLHHSVLMIIIVIKGIL